MVENKGTEDWQRAAYRLKSTSVDNKQRLVRKATGCRQ